MNLKKTSWLVYSRYRVEMEAENIIALCNKYLTTRTFPEIWTNQLIIQIIKPDRELQAHKLLRMERREFLPHQKYKINWQKPA